MARTPEPTHSPFQAVPMYFRGLRRYPSTETKLGGTEMLGLREDWITATLDDGRVVTLSIGPRTINLEWDDEGGQHYALVSDLSRLMNDLVVTFVQPADQPKDH